MSYPQINKVLLAGTLEDEPDLRCKNPPLVQFELNTFATDPAHGLSQQRLLVIARDALAKSVSKTLHKGSCVFVEGFLQTREMADKYYLQVVLQSFSVIAHKRFEDLTA